MKFNSKIHPLPHLVKSMIGSAEFLFSKPKNKLFVLNFHSTPKKFIPEFEKLIDFLSGHFTFITPPEFFKLLNEKKYSGENKLLITFDDGLKNNLFALEVLNKRNISSMLFIVPGFIESTDQKNYYIQNIRPVINPAIDNETEDFTALSLEELNTIKNKHYIGCHTYSHTIDHTYTQPDLIDHEILTSKKVLEEKLKVSINSFCSINNTLLTVNPAAAKVIASNYNFHFTTLAGSNYSAPNPLFIKRINIECYWLKGAVKFSMGHFYLSRWAERIKLYDKICMENK